MVIGNIDNSTTADRQKHVANLLAIVQQRTAEHKRLEQQDNERKQLEQQHQQQPQQQCQQQEDQRQQHNHNSSGQPLAAKRVYSVPKSALPGYQYKNDTALPHLEINLKPTIEPRPYQHEALAAVTSEDTAQSGIVVLPCGAGKTLTSILVASAIQKSVLVVCSTIIAAEQFQQEFLRSTTLMASRMGMFAGNKKWPFNGVSGVLFTTYTMLVESKNRTADSKRMAQFVEKTEWGLIILDEVHCGPAANYSRAITKIKAKVRLGLTATMLREDEKIGDLETIVGPTLYQAKWKELADRGYIAKVICTQVESKLSPRLLAAYEELSEKAPDENNSFLGQRHHMKSLLSILNPQKMQLCQRLIQYHEAVGDKVLVYCDHIEALKLYAEKIGRPYIYGGTPTPEAQELLKRFQIDASVPKSNENGEALTWSQLAALRAERAKQINTLFLSRIGDTSLDLPAATVLIQVSSHFGSRRQEAQRLGRVLRAKKRNERGFYSRFYTMVSEGTHEVTFSEKRRQFLEEECGYGYQIWKVGVSRAEAVSNSGTDDSSTAGNGWIIDADPSTTIPLDDRVQLDPITCHIEGTGKRPYDTPEEEEGLVRYIMGLKNFQVEDEDDDTSIMTMTGSKASTGSKRKRATTATVSSKR